MMDWLANQFRHHQLFRRLILLHFTGLYTYITLESFSFAYFAIGRGLSAGDTVTVLGALQVLITTLMGYMYNTYSRSAVHAKPSD